MTNFLHPQLFAVMALGLPLLELSAQHMRLIRSDRFRVDLKKNKWGGTDCSNLVFRFIFPPEIFKLEDTTSLLEKPQVSGHTMGDYVATVSDEGSGVLGSSSNCRHGLSCVIHSRDWSGIPLQFRIEEATSWRAIHKSKVEIPLSDRQWTFLYPNCESHFRA